MNMDTSSYHGVRPELPAELEVKAVTCFNIHYIHRKRWHLGTGSVPKAAAGKSCAPKELGQASWFTAWQVTAKTRNETAEFPGESPSRPAALWVRLESPFHFFFFLFSVWINCPLGHQELDKAERSWLISSWAGEERWRQSFLHKAPVVLSPEELKKKTTWEHLIQFLTPDYLVLKCSRKPILLEVTPKKRVFF